MTTGGVSGDRLEEIRAIEMALLSMGPRPTPLPESAPKYMRRDNQRLIDAWEALDRLRDPDYSPSFQDEYQRLWHEAAAERDRLLSRLEAAEQRADQAERLIGADTAEDVWRMYSEPVTEDTLICMKPSHRDLEARAEAAEADARQYWGALEEAEELAGLLQAGGVDAYTKEKLWRFLHTALGRA